ncbi:MAG: hypothetical protein IVW51_06405 [Thermaceae bacterium]|nr:hypothetical protein [Thermaceae bacterium]
MSQICNGGGGGGQLGRTLGETPIGLSLEALTEYEVEQGSASLANSLRSILSAISAVELRAPTMVSSHVEAALEACKIAVNHYATVMNIDPNRGASEKEKHALRSVNLHESLQRWSAENLIPDLVKSAEEVEKAAATGNPAALLEVFNSRLVSASKHLEAIYQGPLISNKVIQWEIWRATSVLIDVLMTGQMIAIINREANALLESA